MMKDIPRGVLPVWKFASKEVVRYILNSVNVSVPKKGLLRIHVSDGKRLCRLDLTEMKGCQTERKDFSIPIALWRSIPKAKRSGNDKTFDIIVDPGDNLTQMKIKVRWRERTAETAVSDWNIEGRYPDVDKIFKDIEDADIKHGVYDSELMADTIKTIHDICKGMGSFKSAIKLCSYKGDGLSIRTSGDTWKLSVVIMGMVKTAVKL